ncbi:MAG: rod shape-determining protein RodA [Caldithrix sp.]|nr:MAG: rod shape-determining protein RodA [Caldithrix sp.]TDI88246.1 MAG: rod shape-determining protein RodA [Caldithrix sp.]TDI97316.1 MAG: rod shape-determining protein RodA [Caldithrix sp.]
MLSEHKSIRHLDFKLLATVVVLMLFGLVAIYSATFVDSESDLLNFKKQIIWGILGLLVLAGTIFIPIRVLNKYAYTVYGISVFLLFAVLMIGTGAGTDRWFALGPIRIQPSELAKVGTLLVLAKYLSKENRDLNNFRELAIAFSLVFLPLLLVMKQPDLGSALVFLALILPMLHWAGLSSMVLFVLIAPLISLVCAFNYYTFLIAMLIISAVLFLSQRGLTFFLVNFVLNIGVGVVTPIMWNLMKEYQQKRILTFLGLVTDPHGLGYQVIQSKVSIGSGGFWGKGFLQGTQTQLRFLPEQHTDFIFCVIGEEFGFLGIFAIFALFFYLIFKGLTIASEVKSKFSSILVFGGVIIFLFQIVVNIGMTIGIMPVTGLPLPFLSYGGSALISNLVIVGLLLNASRKRFEYF